MEIKDKMNKHNRFNRGGCYTCRICMKKTRNTGCGEAGIGLCKKCMNIAELENALDNSEITLDEFNKQLEEINHKV